MGKSSRRNRPSKAQRKINKATSIDRFKFNNAFNQSTNKCERHYATAAESEKKLAEITKKSFKEKRVMECYIGNSDWSP
tara:strand:- start:804 stop:1040 length:237 start_codon:yes stop_codon:yes gene_type:complete